MSLINTTTRELHCKLIYWGPRSSGKTENLRFIQRRALPNQPHALQTWVDTTGHTAFFDQLTIPFGTLQGLRTYIHVFAVPGTPGYAHTRAALLGDLDGIVFVADSRQQAQAVNEQSFRELQTLLQASNTPDLPIVLQYNHRDAPNACDLQTLDGQLGQAGPCFEASAIKGSGVLATLKKISDLVFAKL